MDFVTALEQQIHRIPNSGGGGGGGIGGDANETANGENNLANATSDANFSPKEMRKFDSKKRWKNWGWKYSPGKTSSIEEEPVEVSSTKTSRHSSPTSSPKHKKSSDSTAATVVSNLLNQSPLRRRPQSGQSRNANGKMANNSTSNQNNNSSGGNAARNIDIRSSAGARLCQTLENLEDDDLQALIINGRPASVHIVPMSSSQIQ